MAGEIAVGAYVTEPAHHKLTSHGWGLVGAVFQQQPPTRLQVLRCGMDDLTQRRHPIRAGSERNLRLMLESCVVQCRVALRNVRWITDDQVEPPPRQGPE